MTYNFSLQPFYVLYDYVVLMYSILLFDIICISFAKKQEKNFTRALAQPCRMYTIFVKSHLSLVYHQRSLDGGQKKNEHHFPECIHVCTSLVNFLGFLVHHLSHTYKNAD